MIAASLLVWLALAAITISFAFRYRAIVSIQNLASESWEGGTDEAQRSLTNIQTWLNLKNWLYSLPELKPLPAWTNSAISILYSLFTHTSIDRTALESLKCIDCSPRIVAELKNYSRLANVELSKDNLRSEILNQVQQLKGKQTQLISLHILISKDFSALVRTPSLYDSQGREKLLYIPDGVFQFLPQLNESAVNQDNSAPNAIDNFAKRLARIKEQSEKIVQEYLQNEKLILQKNEELSKLEREFTHLNKEIKRGLLSVLLMEAQGYNP